MHGRRPSIAGKTKRVVGYMNGEFQDFDIIEALEMSKGLSQYQVEINARFP